MENVFLSIDNNVFKETKEKARQNAKEELGENAAEDLIWSSLKTEWDEIGFRDGKLSFSGDLRGPETKLSLGYVSSEIELPFDTVIAILEHFVKKVNKVKTVLEAVE